MSNEHDDATDDDNPAASTSTTPASTATMAAMDSAPMDSASAGSNSVMEPPESLGRVKSSGASTGDEHAAPVLIALVLVTLCLEASLWLSGARGSDLARAVDQGAARVEARLRGELSDDDALEAIRLQDETLGFWLALAALRDFVIEPSRLVIRTLLITLATAAALILRRREVRWPRLATAIAQFQAIWVLGLLIQVLLEVGFQRPAELGLRLFLPAGTYSAWLWIAAGQITVFGCLGWLATLVMVVYRFGASLWLSLMLFSMVAISEWLGLCLYQVLLQAGMRTTLIPG